MKTLLILRHAKSDHGDPSITDHDRPLNNRGKCEAQEMGKLIAAENLVPDLIISSSALRAKTTAELVAKACQYKHEIILDSSIYADGVDSYIKILQAIPDQYDRIMMVGHNPDLEYLVQTFTNKADPFPTAALALFDFSIKSWREMNLRVKTTFVNFWRPKEI